MRGNYSAILDPQIHYENDRLLTRAGVRPIVIKKVLVEIIRSSLTCDIRKTVVSVYKLMSSDLLTGFTFTFAVSIHL